MPKLHRPSPHPPLVDTLPAAVPRKVGRECDKEVALFSRWSIQFKLLLCVALLLLIVGTLAFSGFRGAYSYKQLARTISIRAAELPLAGELSTSLGDMRVTLSRIRQQNSLRFKLEISEFENDLAREQFRNQLGEVRHILHRYRKRLETDFPSDPRLGDYSHERKTVNQLQELLAELTETQARHDWVMSDIDESSLIAQVDEMHRLAGTLPADLHQRMRNFVGEVQGDYRTWIYLEWINTVLAVSMLLALIGLSYRWVVAPLHVLIEGSRRIAKCDDFNYRIYLKSDDEMAELADAMNAMTARFQEIRNDLDAQVKQRTKEVVRGEQMASVGFLAAGVAHEINNPLASIAMCAESLESRLHDIISAEEGKPDEEQNSEIAILRRYLRRIQDEAFRCKGITDSLLDFSRLGDVEKVNTDLRELIEGVIDMVRHLGKYREKHIEFACDAHVVAPVNAQEIKQVVLNLITNALDSLDPGGVVRIQLRKRGENAELLVSDNGCGMTDEVLKHLFEPFFTRRRDGQGTGLGLSITYRIINDHGGTIEPSSLGPGRGSQFSVQLPLVASKEMSHERQRQNRLQAA